MRIKINLTKPTTDVPVNNQHQLNGFIYKTFGENCTFHDTFSDYNISSLQGGKLKDDKKTLVFNNSNPYFYVSSNNDDFISLVIKKFRQSQESFFGMKVEEKNGIEFFDDFIPNIFFDKVITISPILLKRKDGYKLTVKDPDFLNLLIENCKKKLEYCGIIDNTFNIEYFNYKLAKTKSIYVGDVFNPCSLVSLVIYGKPETRKILYNLGLGNSTGSGFGSIAIFKKLNNNNI
jgi:CRISPR-associated endoribonuclease Cas6